MKFVCEITDKDGKVVDFAPYVDKHVNVTIKQFTTKKDGDYIVLVSIDGTDNLLSVKGTFQGWSVPSYTDSQLMMWDVITDFVYDRGQPTCLAKEYLKCKVGLGRTKRDTLYVKYVDNVHAEPKETK